MKHAFRLAIGLLMLTNAHSQMDIDSVKNWMYHYDMRSRSKIVLQRGREESLRHRTLFQGFKKIVEQAFGKQNQNYAGLCLQVGGSLEVLGEYELAEKEYTEAMQIIESIAGKENFWYLTALRDLFLLKTKISYDSALLFEANNIVDKIYKDKVYNHVKNKQWDSTVIAFIDTKYQMAAYFTRTGNFSVAEGLLKNNMQLLEVAGEKNLLYINHLYLLGQVYRSMGNYKEAEKTIGLGKMIAESLGKGNASYFLFANALAEFYSEIRKQHSKAAMLYKEVNTLIAHTQGKSNFSYVDNSLKLAKLLWTMNKPLQAERLFTEVNNINRQIIDNVFSFTTEAEKQDFIARQQEKSDLFNSFYHEYPSIKKTTTVFDLALGNKELVLSSAKNIRNSIFSGTDTLVSKQYQQWLDLREGIAIMQTQGQENKDDSISLLTAQATALEKKLTRTSIRFKNQQQRSNTNWQTIRQNLKRDDAIIEFVQYRYYEKSRKTDSIFYMALLIRSDLSQPVAVRLFEKKQLDALLPSAVLNSANINQLYLHAKRKKAGRATTLYKLLWQPLEKHLTNIRRIYFSPTGQLHRISFATIAITKDKLLTDKYELVQLSTSASLVQNQYERFGNKDEFNLYGGIYYDADSAALLIATLYYNITDSTQETSLLALNRGEKWEYLPGTQDEVNFIAKEGLKHSIPVKLFNGNDGTEESLKFYVGNRSPSVLHIATHGFFFPNPNEQTNDIRWFNDYKKRFAANENALFRCGLLLAGANRSWKGKPIKGSQDGILTAYEVSNMYLPNTKLVVLSACETALGDIHGSEGVYGLQRAFKMAGVQNLVMSLWKVPDAETAEFMHEFYKHLFNKQTIQDAFYKAQTTMKNKYRHEPYKWAAWVLVR